MKHRQLYFFSKTNKEEQVEIMIQILLHLLWYWMKKIVKKIEPSNKDDGIKNLLMHKDKKKDIIIEPKISVLPKDIQLLDSIFSNAVKRI